MLTYEETRRKKNYLNAKKKVIKNIGT